MFSAELIFFALFALNDLPNVRIPPKSTSHVQKSDCHYGRREKDFALGLVMASALRFGIAPRRGNCLLR